MKQILIAVDQLANAVIGGWADEALSARSYRAHRDGKLLGKITMPVIDLLFFWQGAWTPAACTALPSGRTRNTTPG